MGVLFFFFLQTMKRRSDIGVDDGSAKENASKKPKMVFKKSKLQELNWQSKINYY